MPHITVIDESMANDQQRAAFDRARQMLGVSFVPAVFASMAHDPGGLSGLATMVCTFRDAMGLEVDKQLQPALS